MTFRQHLRLAPGHTLLRTGSRAKGFMGEREIDSYDVVDATGVKVGQVEYEEHTAVKGFKRTNRVIQRDAGNALLVDFAWDGG